MFSIFGYILFIIFTILSLKYIFSATAFVKDPIEKNQMMTVTGSQRFFLFLLATGIFSLGDMMAARLLFNIIFCFMAIFYCKEGVIKNAVFVLYVLYLIWLIIAIGYSPVPFFGIRVFLKYLYPILVFALATQLVSSKKFVFKGLKTIIWVGVAGILFLVFLGQIPFIKKIAYAIFWWPPAIMDFLPTAICVSLALFSFLHKKNYLWIALLFVLPCIVGVNRTGLVSASLAIVMFSVIRYRFKSLPYIVAGIALFALVVLYVPEFREKMFVKKGMTTEDILTQRNDLTLDDINSNGRFVMWEWSLARFYMPHKWTGSGLGVLQEVFYSYKHPFGTIRIVHNDYVQILCDTGLIGLILYLLIYIFLFIHSIRLAWNKSNPVSLRIVAIITGPSAISMLAAMYTDNVVNYSLMTLSYPFALYGLMVGLEKRLKNPN